MTMDTNPDHLDDESLSALLDGDAGETGIAAHVRRGHDNAADGGRDYGEQKQRRVQRPLTRGRSWKTRTTSYGVFAAWFR